MSALALPCKCKLCGKTIGNFALEWPPPKDNAAMESLNQQQFQAFCQALNGHLQEQARQGQKDHLAILARGISTGGNLTMLLIAQQFDIPEPAKQFFRESRTLVHNLTRSFWMTDADLEMLARLTAEKVTEDPTPGELEEEYYGRALDANSKVITDLLHSLRDNYEAGAEPPPAEAPKVIV
jgi:hypothetical protein